jgi:hypothetical protein
MIKRGGLRAAKVPGLENRETWGNLREIQARETS